MSLGNLVLDETGSTTGLRVLSTDATGTTLEVSLQLEGTIRGTAETTYWTYTQLIRPDGSIYGSGQGVMMTADGDVLNIIGHGSGQAAGPGDSTNFRTMLHVHTTAEKYADLNIIGLAGEYDIAPDGSAVNKCWEWS
jgi:hypothetical protein